MNTSPAVVCLTDVSKLYEARRDRPSGIRHVTFEAGPGELVLFLGPSGSGKTTLLTLAAGLLAPTTGRVELFRRDLADMAPAELQRVRALRIGFVFQTFRLFDALTVEENVRFVHQLVRSYGAARDSAWEGLLNQLGLAPLRKEFPPRLSQGEKQRLAIARALANDPDLIIADEPTASLSSEDCAGVIRILHQAAVSGKCVLVATHDGRLAGHADRVVELRDGAVVSDRLRRPGTRAGESAAAVPAITSLLSPQATVSA